MTWISVFWWLRPRPGMNARSAGSSSPTGTRLAAEIQHRLLPGSYTCEAGQFTLAAWLEPAGNVGGDTFDFALERDALHLSMTDAMGHEVEAAVLATVLVGALRNARRAGVGLAEQAGRAHTGPGGFARRGGGVARAAARRRPRFQTGQ